MAVQLTQGVDQQQIEALLAQEIANGARLVVYQYVISLVVVSFKRSSGVKLVRGGESRLLRAFRTRC
jgi:hypothetical protein